eukprot:SAG31_NODE_5513_length_2485_cov_2.063286_5_plen_77_part_00
MQLRKWVAEQTLVGQEWLMGEPDGGRGKKKSVQQAVNKWIPGISKVDIADYCRIEIGTEISGRIPTPRPPPTSDDA